MDRDGLVDGDLRRLAFELKGGEPAAWERFYKLTHLPLLRFLRRWLRDDALAEEVLQAAYVTAVERIDRFDPSRGAADAWLAGIARHKAQEAGRRARREAVRPEKDDLPAPPGADGVDGELVALALDQIEPRYAEVLRRKYLAEESLEAIAVALSLKEATVGTLLHRGRERFREVYRRLLTRSENGTWMKRA